MLTFEEALVGADGVHKKRHLLLGNGFSIAARPDSFRYGRLLEEADLTTLSVSGAELFASEGTSDFEGVFARYARRRGWLTFTRPATEVWQRG